MSTILLGTNAVRLGEPCYSLKEIMGPAPDSKSVRRWQAITVIRQDRPVQFRRDMGRADTFKAGEFGVITGLTDPTTGRIECLHTVGEAIDIANYLRSDAYEPLPTPVASDLIGQYHELPDRQRRARKRQSQSGPVARIQRS